MHDYALNLGKTNWFDWILTQNNDEIQHLFCESLQISSSLRLFLAVLPVQVAFALGKLHLL